MDPLKIDIRITIHQGWRHIGLTEQTFTMEATPDILSLLVEDCGNAAQRLAWRAINAAQDELDRRKAEESSEDEGDN